MELYKKFVKHVTFPLIAKSDGFHRLSDHLKKLEESQYWDRDKIIEYQFNRVRSLLIHAYNNTGFYKNRFNDVGFDPLKFDDLNDLKQIPPLTKDDIQNHLNALVATNFNKSDIHRDATGGSTGCHTPFYRDNACLSFKKAIEYRHNSWAGWDVGNKIAYYWPAIQDMTRENTLKSRIKNVLSYRSLMLYAGKLDEQQLEEHYRQLSIFKPTILRVFPNPLSILAKYILDSNKNKIYIPSIISVGEPLMESQRELFSKVFGSKVFNCYVSRECSNMACECDNESNLLHINSEMLYIEFDDNNNQGINSPDNLLVTDLINSGMPFIRYKIEDLGTSIQGTCKCGRGLPLMKMDSGRISDFLISPFDRSKVSGCSFLHHLIAEGPAVGQVQVVQDKADHLVLKIASSKRLSNDNLTHFDSVVNNIFKGVMKYQIEYVDKIDKEKSGKYLFTKCLLSKSDL